MNKSIVFTLLLLSALSAHANPWSGNANFILGTKTLDDTDWTPFDEQVAFGILVDFKQQSWPISIAIDLLGSLDEETVLGIDTEASTTEFDIGIRKIWEVSGSSIRPFIGGGLALVNAEIKATNVVTASIDDDGTGIWLNGGVYWTLGQHFNLGLQARYSKAEVQFLGVDIEAGGTTVAVMLGYHW